MDYNEGLQYDDSNKYDLQILSNWYKEEGQFEGNGAYASYVKGCFDKTGENFLIYPLNGQFFLWVGPGKDLVNIDRQRLTGEDFFNYERSPYIFYKYANLLLDRYIENVLNKI